jgi:hypothetical protein
MANPPNKVQRAGAWAHLSQYLLDMAYIPTKGITEAMREYKRRITDILHTIDGNTCPRPTLLIERKFPATHWKTVWRNLHTAGLADSHLSVWYNIIHDIIPTHERLAAIKIAPNIQCVICGATDTLLHRLVQCTMCAVLWNWTRGKIAELLRVHHSAILAEWTIRPFYHFWPVKKQSAITWILAQFVCYRTHTQRRQALQDYIDFMRRARWKCFEQYQNKRKVGTYLDGL